MPYARVGKFLLSGTWIWTQATNTWTWTRTWTLRPAGLGLGLESCPVRLGLDSRHAGLGLDSLGLEKRWTRCNSACIVGSHAIY